VVGGLNASGLVVDRSVLGSSFFITVFISGTLITSLVLKVFAYFDTPKDGQK